MNGGDLVDRGVIWLYTVEGVLMFQSNKLYLKSTITRDSFQEHPQSCNQDRSYVKARLRLMRVIGT